MDKLLTYLRKFIANHSTGNYIGLLYSGGIDSSIIAKILVSLWEPSRIAAGSVGLDNSYDLLNAAYGAKKLGLTFMPQILDSQTLSEIILELKEIDFIKTPVHLSVAIPMYLAIKRLKEQFNVSCIFLGQGADELFGGYNRYVLEIERNGYESLQKMMKNDLNSLIYNQLPMEGRIGNKFELKLLYPFLDQNIINYAQSYPATDHIIYSEDGEIVRKALLRKLALNIGLQNSVAKQQKKAIQYSSGTIKILRRYVKQEGFLNIQEWFKNTFQ